MNFEYFINPAGDGWLGFIVPVFSHQQSLQVQSDILENGKVRLTKVEKDKFFVSITDLSERGVKINYISDSLDNIVESPCTDGCIANLVVAINLGSEIYLGSRLDMENWIARSLRYLAEKLAEYPRSMIALADFAGLTEHSTWMRSSLIHARSKANVVKTLTAYPKPYARSLKENRLTDQIISSSYQTDTGHQKKRSTHEGFRNFQARLSFSSSWKISKPGSPVVNSSQA